MPAVTDREAWLLAKHMPLDDTAVRIVEYALEEYHQFDEPYVIKDLVASITYAGSSHTMSLMTDIVWRVTGVTVEVKDYDEDEVFDFLCKACREYDFYFTSTEHDKVNLRNAFDSFDEYSDMCRKYLHPMLLTDEECTRRLLELSISHHNQCLQVEATIGLASDVLPSVLSTALGCIPSSTCILDYELVHLLMIQDDELKKPKIADRPGHSMRVMPVVCRSWREHWMAEAFCLDTVVCFSD